MSWAVVVQSVVTGLATGAAYGLVAAGFVLVFRLTGILHFAHGDLLGAGLFVGLLAATGLAVSSTPPGTGRYVVLVLVAVLVAAAAGAALYAVLLRPAFRRGAEGQWVAITVAVAFVVQAGLAVGFPRAAYIVPDVLPFDRWHPIGLGGGASVPPRSVFVLAVGLAVGLAADLVLTRTRFGLGLRAVADDAVAAALVGVRVDRMVAAAFALAGVLGAVAGLVVAPATTLGPQTGLLLGLKGIAAALLVGLRSPRHAFAGGLAVGLLEAAAVSFHLPEWRDVAPLVVVLIALAWRPPELAREAVE
ncbi:MAG: branched-chain amino acid transport system permease protein [Acidimicrobiaceae bacterium]|nr:branched-chain amino acid transport system permease protein [Acidimicrobiaceae bacterium]